MFPEQLDKVGNPRVDCLQPTGSILTAYKGSSIVCSGTVDINCSYDGREWRNTKFFVVDVPGPAILGLSTCEALHVVTLHCALSNETPQPQKINNIRDLMNQYPQQFDRIGELQKTHKLVVDSNVPSRIDPPRRTPIALRDKIKSELDKMVSQQIIRTIEEPTDWVSSLTYVTKRDGSIRVCLDPRQLNKALIRPRHEAPTLDELNHKFANAKFFSKLDAKAGYWSIKLDDESQKLTTFQTPFGRYCVLRLPFGLSVSQDIFQLEMDRILEKCNGVCGIADDFVVYGTTEIEHDRNLLQFMDIAKQHGLALNSAKCDIKCNKVSFFGQLYTSEGIKPDPQKVNDLRAMPVPTTKAELQQFLGFITYLSRFMKAFSAKSAVLRDLLRQDSDFVWETHHQQAFVNLKNEVSDSSLLHYYDPRKPAYLQCDASLRGIGAALLQPDADGELRPVEYASKSLTPTEQRYACIERELLSIVFGMQRFHTYLYGRDFNVITDHRPLLMITNKPIASAPPRLQRMLIKLHGYNFTMTHRPGSQNQLADGLSRLPSPDNVTTIDLDLRVDLVRFSTERLDQVRRDTSLDAVLNQLLETIVASWPEDVNDLPTDIRSFWSFRDQLSVENGLVLKGQQLVIPRTQQPEILRQLHTAHLGKEKTKLLARDTVYWLNINKDIDRLVQTCNVCQEHQSSQVPEPLLQHDIPYKPWSVLGTDLFEFEGHQWLIIADYYTKYPIIRQLPNPSPSSVVVNATKQIFAEFGIPDRIVSDNGPHFASEAYREFARMWQFDHITTSPRWPQGNGFIERQVRTIKSLLKKSKQSGTDYQLALLHWRTTPINANLASPAQLIKGRRLKSTIPVRIRNDVPNKDDVHLELQRRQVSQKHYFDRRTQSTDLPPLYPGQQVRVQHPTTGRWDPATVRAESAEPRSYILRNMKEFRRNRQHIRESRQLPQTVEATEKTRATPTPLPTVSTETELLNTLAPTLPPSTPARYTTRSGRVVRSPRRLEY